MPAVAGYLDFSLRVFAALAAVFLAVSHRAPARWMRAFSWFIISHSVSLFLQIMPAEVKAFRPACHDLTRASEAQSEAV